MKNLILLILSILPVFAFAESNSSVNTSFVNSGYTWWYHNDREKGLTPDFAAIEADFGIEVGEECIIDGIVWNQLRIKLARHISAANNYSSVRNMPMNIYIREDAEGNIYTYVDESQPLYFAINDCFISYPGINYPFSGIRSVDDSISIDVLWSDSDYRITDVSEINPCGTPLIATTAVATCENPESDFDEVLYIGSVGALNKNGIPSWGELFFAPFQSPTPSFGAWGVPHLTYVTDACDNVVYEHLGGTRIWEEISGISDAASESCDEPVEYYNLQGVRIPAPTTGICIRRTPTSTTKIF